LCCDRDYGDDRFVQAAQHVTTLRDNGRLRFVAACNFDLPHLKEMVEQDVPIVSNQVQYSLLDRRPENGMLAFAKEKGIRLATFGTVAGGLLSDRWLGAPPPTRDQLETVSLRMVSGLTVSNWVSSSICRLTVSNWVSSTTHP
jgi:aryl-alcohol dehydrogenase-like predicted oxidoreductase